MTRPRLRLILLVFRIAVAAIGRILDPKNVAKGDDWPEYSWSKIEMLARREWWEFVRETINPAPRPRRLSEAGDEMVIRAMMIDRAERGEQ